MQQKIIRSQFGKIAICAEFLKKASKNQGIFSLPKYVVIMRFLLIKTNLLLFMFTRSWRPEIETVAGLAFEKDYWFQSGLEKTYV